MRSNAASWIVGIGLLPLGWSACGVLAAAEPTFPPEQIEFFEKHVRPVLVQHCQECHNAKEPEAGFRVDSRAALLKGGDGGTAVHPGNPDGSKLVQAIRYNGNLLMPPEKKLPPEAVEALTKWVKDGAAWPAETAQTADASGHKPNPASPEAIAKARAEHWAFQPIKDQPLPEVKAKDWPANEVDRFILAVLEGHGLKPSPGVDRRTLLRRAKFDLHGLPPSWEEIQEFEKDESPGAYAKLIDRLLAAPEYGQRWGRYWLDIARYADTKGYVFQEERRYPFAYTFRDYVVASFNEDKSYKEFLLEQLAADRLPAGDDKTNLAAMGFLTVGRRFLNNQNDIIDDRIDVVMRGLQGLTVACARCHDHKFDPIPTADYYSLYGVFASSEEPGDLPQIGEPKPTKGYMTYEKELGKRQEALDKLKGELHVKQIESHHRRLGEYLVAAADGKGKSPNDLRMIAQERKLHQRTIERWQRRLAMGKPTDDFILAPWMVLAGVPADKFEAEAKSFLEKAGQPADKGGVNVHPKLKQALQSSPPKNRAELAARYDAVFAAMEDARKKGLEAKPPKETLDDADLESLRQFAYNEKSPTAVKLEELDAFLNRDEQNKIREVRKKVEQFRASSPDAPPRAMVMVDKGNPVNPHIFRRGNPGNGGDRVPRQYLAVVEGPNRKAYEKGSGRLEMANTIASENNPLTARVWVNRVWMHHFGQGLVRTPSDFGVRCELPSHPALLDYLAARFMKEGWSTKSLHRWIMLSKTYQQSSQARPDANEKDPENRFLSHMNRRRLDFESMRDSLLEASGRLDHGVGGRAVDIFTRPYSTRRSIYAFIDRQNLEGVFRTFDLASPDYSNAQRFVTTVPQQALYLMNSPFVLEQARYLVKRSQAASSSDPQAQATAMYRFALGRDPSAAEMAMALEYVRSLPAVAAAETDAIDPWHYGWGAFDEKAGKTAAFTSFAHFTGNSWQGGPALPAPQTGWTSINAEGGHPGTPTFQVIRRWVAPRDGIVRISGKLNHPSDQGDGVRARIVTERGGKLGEWIAKKGATDTRVERLEVEAGEAIDFVVDCRENEAHDSFQWAPFIKMTEASGPPQPGDKMEWSAQKDFNLSKPDDLQDVGPWDRLAQVLLLTNEFMFVD